MADESARTRGAPYFHKHEMEIESGYPSESDARAPHAEKYERPMIDNHNMQLDALNESKISYTPLVKARIP